MIAENSGKRYRRFESLAEAVAHSGFVVMEGDDGGQIYLTCPASVVKCGETGLRRVLGYLDSMAWNDPSMVHLCYEELWDGNVAGGMGGGNLTNDIWIHPQLSKPNLLREVRAFVKGQSQELSSK